MIGLGRLRGFFHEVQVRRGLGRMVEPMLQFMPKYERHFFSIELLAWGRSRQLGQRQAYFLVRSSVLATRVGVGQRHDSLEIALRHYLIDLVDQCW